MKVIHVVLGKANPNRMNGVNKVAHQLAMNLHAHQVPVEIWGITKTPTDAVYPRPFPTRLFRSQPIYRGLDPNMMFAITQEKKNTIFHIHGGFITDFYKLTQLLKEINVEYVYTPHGAFNKVALEKNKWIKKIYISRYEKFILRNAKAIQLLGQSEFDHLGTIIRLSNKVVIPNGQDFEELMFDFTPMKNRSVPVFGFCGRLDTYYKGLDFLLEGFASYCKKGGNGELWLIGDGPDRPQLEALCKLYQIEMRVHFMGARYGKDKLNRIANMDVFCHPSRSEGSPTAVLEAGALGKALIISTATNVGSEVEKYNAGFHIRQSTSKSIENAMFSFLKTYQSGEYLEFGKQAKEMVKTDFSWGAVTKKLMDLYDYELPTVQS
ncbi:MAG: glycosyltransferase family 4 protein [Bacteroidia bacterium]